MDIDLNNIDFAIAVNTFHDDIQDKLQILSKMELQFLRKFQHRVKISEHHSEMIFEIRKIVSNIEEMYKDIKDYFVEMKVQFVYDFVRKIQTLMVIGYNHLSQALLITFDMYQAERKKQKQTKPALTCSCKAKNDYFLSKDQLKRLQHIDYTITNIQSEEQRLLMEMETIYDRMMMQKSLIDKVKPSLASKQLEQMKDHIQTVMQNNEKLFEETYMMKFFEFHNHIKKLDKPEKITQVYHKMNDSLKQNFVKQAMKAANKIERARRHNPQNMCSVQIQTQEITKGKKGKDGQNKDLNSPSLFKQSTVGSTHYTLAKERKLNQKMSIELNHLQKQNLALTEELNSYKFAQKQIQIKYRELVQKFEIVEGMYRKAKMELDELKNGSQWNVQKLELENQRIRHEISVLRGRSDNMNEFVGRQVQTDQTVKSILSRKNSREFVCQFDMVLEEKQTQTYEEYMLPNNDDEVIKLLKTRNQKAIIMLNEKDRKIRESNGKIGILEDESSKIKSSLNIFVGIIEQKFGGTKEKEPSLNKAQQSRCKKRSILEMTSHQIQQKIKQVLNLIVSKTIQKTQEQNLPQLNGKFRKLTSLNQNQLRIQTLPEQESHLDTIYEHTSKDSNNQFHKTLSDLRPEFLQSKKKKRLSVLNILATKKNLALKTNVATQTENLEEEKGKNFSQTRQFQTQTAIDEKKSKSKSTKKNDVRNSIQIKKERPYYEQGVSAYRKRKNFPLSSRNSQSAFESRQRKQDQRINLNSFEKIKIEEVKIKKIQPSHLNREMIRTGLQSFDMNRKMVSTSPVAFRKDKNTTNSQQEAHKIFQTTDLSPFNTNKEDNNTYRFSSLLDDSTEIQQDKMVCKYNENDPASKDSTLNEDKFTIKHSTTMSSFGSVFRGNDKFKLKKQSHNRLISQITTRAEPIQQVSQAQKENDISNLAYCPHNTYSGEMNFTKLSNGQKLAFTSNQAFNKLRSEQQKVRQNSQKRKSLLLSIQKYKSENSSMNDILLGKYLSKVIEKWGKDKVKDVFENLLVNPTMKKQIQLHS